MNKPVKIIRRAMFLAGCFLASHVSANVGTAPVAATAPAPVAIVEQAPERASTSTADHSKFDELKKDFKSGMSLNYSSYEYSEERNSL